MSASTTAPTRRRILGTSLKMYFDLPNTLVYVKAVSQLASLAAKNNIDLFIVPDFVSLYPSATLLENTDILLGAQDCFYESKGAYTGEISPVNLAQVGVKIVEIGHAERRKLFWETDHDIAKKAKAIVDNAMIPLVCIGERTLPGHIVSQAVGLAVQECKVQIKTVLAAVPPEAEVVFAYEPVWAIGAEEPASADHVVAVTQELRRLVESTGHTGLVRILYGGSAGPGTFNGLKESVDGLFLGRFAHDLANLEKVIREMGE